MDIQGTGITESRVREKRYGLTIRKYSQEEILNISIISVHL